MKYYAVGTRMSCPCNKVWERPGDAHSMMKELNFQFKTIGEYPDEEKMVVEGEGAYWESKTGRK
ncbi:MAG: hypothetical protein IPG59_03550 [Candidatus Melainabacteria bacterium]|nr:MAG: hypothetical protein IPG59_03550 [Candidatus Melainabacteria bacterium]